MNDVTANREVKKLIAARNRAESLIKDAMARYVKEKTRARNKAAAMERDALLNNPKFACLNAYESVIDIQNFYGAGGISEQEYDQLIKLWEEREALKDKIVDGRYSDDVTKCLEQAIISIRDYGQDTIDRIHEDEMEAKDPGDYASLVILRPPHADILAIQNRRLRVEWVNLNEGECGDYNKDDPEDINYLRFDVYCRETPSDDWRPVEDASYSTQVPAGTPCDVLEKKLRTIFDQYNLFIDEILNGGSVKKLGERLSWITA